MQDAPYRFFLLALCLTSAFACPSPSSSRPDDRSSATGSDVRPASPQVSPASRYGPSSHDLPETAATREAMILAFNAERTRAGVSPLRSDPALEMVAQERADAIAKKGALPTEAEAARMLGVRVESNGLHR